MNYQELAVAQDTLMTDLNTRIKEFVTQFPTVEIQAVYYNFAMSSPTNPTNSTLPERQLCSTMSVTDGGATVTRTTQPTGGN